jgi:hypothetical protein
MWGARLPPWNIYHSVGENESEREREREEREREKMRRKGDRKFESLGQDLTGRSLCDGIVAQSYFGWLV